MATNEVLIPLEKFVDLMKKIEQRDAMLRYARAERYAVNVRRLFDICGEPFPADTAGND